MAKFSFITSFSKSSLGYCFQCSGRERIASVNSRGTEEELSANSRDNRVDKGVGARQEEK